VCHKKTVKWTFWGLSHYSHKYSHITVIFVSNDWWDPILQFWVVFGFAEKLLIYKATVEYRWFRKKTKTWVWPKISFLFCKKTEAQKSDPLPIISFLPSLEVKQKVATRTLSLISSGTSFEVRLIGNERVGYDRKNAKKTNRSLWPVISMFFVEYDRSYPRFWRIWPVIVFNFIGYE